MLDQKGVVRDAYDAIVSSGDLALGVIRERGWTRIYGIGPHIARQILKEVGIEPGVKAAASQIAVKENATPPTAQRHRGPGTSPVGNHSRASSRPVGTPTHSQVATQPPARVSGP